MNSFTKSILVLYLSVVANADRERGSMWNQSSACAEPLGAELWRLASKYSIVHYLYSTAAVIREEIPLLRNSATAKLRLETDMMLGGQQGSLK